MAWPGSWATTAMIWTLSGFNPPQVAWMVSAGPSLSHYPSPAGQKPSSSLGRPYSRGGWAPTALAGLSRNHKWSERPRPVPHREFCDGKSNHSLTVASSFLLYPMLSLMSPPPLLQLRVSSVGPCSSAIMSQGLQDLTQTSSPVVVRPPLATQPCLQDFCSHPFTSLGLQEPFWNSELQAETARFPRTWTQ